MSRRRSLIADERGAIMVIGLFAAALLIGFLYYVLGIGQALHHTERMQDGADSGAYSVAVMHARAMNLLALINMIELSVVALVSALLAVIAACVATIAWILAGGYWRWIAYGWVIPFLIIVMADAASTYSDASDSIDAIHDASERAQEVLIEDLPEIASFRANRIVNDHFSPPVRAAFSFPLTDLPVEDGSVFDMCLRAYPYAFASAWLALGDVPALANRARGYAAAFIPVFCLAQGIEPKRVEDDAELGGEDFQLRVFAIGDPLPTLGESGVKMATWQYDDSGGGRTAHLRSVLSRAKLSQAEYYFDGHEGHSSMLWHMGWRARMRRFRSPDHYGSFGAECALFSGEGALCAELAVYFQTLGLAGAFAH